MQGPNVFGELVAGIPVRLEGLQGAVHLNGQVGLVHRLVRETGRYEVVLQESGDLKSVQLANLVPLPLLEEVTAWRDRLTKPLQPAAVKAALDRLSELPVTVEVLQQTGIGRVVNDTTKRLVKNADEAASIGKVLVLRWRKMFQHQLAMEKLSAAAPAAAAEVPAKAAPPTAAPAASPASPEAPKVGAAAGPAAKRPRREDSDGGLSDATASKVPQATTASAPRSKEATATAPASPDAAQPQPLRAEVIASAESLPPELRDIDPRIAKVLLERPTILEFLSKHRSVMLNLNATTVAFLTRNLRNSKGTQRAGALTEVGSHASSMIAISDLPPPATEDDLAELLTDMGLAAIEITIPRESRRQRSCGVAFVVLPSREAACEAVRKLRGIQVWGAEVRVDLADGTPPHSGRSSQHRVAAPGGGSVLGAEPRGSCGSRRIRWRGDEELWHVALYDCRESVAEFAERLASAEGTDAPAAAYVPLDHAARFQEATRREHEEERKLVRNALAHAPGVEYTVQI